MCFEFSGQRMKYDGSANNEVFFAPDEKAYTKDNILIYNIFLYNIPRWMKMADITRYFSKFGVISEVRLADDKKRSHPSWPTVGFVNFVEPESAYRVLQKFSHRIRYPPIGVKAGHSLNQPDGEKAYRQVVRGSQQMKAKVSNVISLNVLSLNHDCLEIICGLLGLRDQIRYVRVCNRFQEIFQMLSRRAYTRLDFDETIRLPLCEILDFFRLAGKNIEDICSLEEPYWDLEYIMKSIEMRYDNVKRITLVGSRMKPDRLKKLFRSFPLLIELYLHFCETDDHLIESLQYLTQLETLTLTKRSKITGKFVNSLVQLKVLNLYGCRNIQTSNLVEICRSMPYLKSLDIRRCEQLSAIFFDTIAEHCQQLEILKMSCPDFPFEHVSLLPRLKHIELLLHTSVLVSPTQIFFSNWSKISRSN
ncbi:uncharacterized protein LOC129238834 [Anastrepha obliqua]|uniref:uncharacterized protein LOC129238834 n=1 Tax=Anastrepha obliqua TaxID=95512 RepID=UPI00240A3276|nr:uncharacterized protein LOC129238834 [Anastrepha obliqua]